MFQGINVIAFSKKFTNNEECYNYLIAIKWNKVFNVVSVVAKKVIGVELITIEGVNNAAMMKVLQPILCFMV